MSIKLSLYNWHRIVLHFLSSKDNQDFGNLISIENNSFTVHSRPYESITSKNDVERFIGRNMFEQNYAELMENKIKPSF